MPNSIVMSPILFKQLLCANSHRILVDHSEVCKIKRMKTNYRYLYEPLAWRVYAG